MKAHAAKPLIVKELTKQMPGLKSRVTIAKHSRLYDADVNIKVLNLPELVNQVLDNGFYSAEVRKVSNNIKEIANKFNDDRSDYGNDYVDMDYYVNVVLS